MSLLRMFIAHPSVLARYKLVVPSAVAYYLTPGATFAVLPLDDALQDALHRANGTGEWLDAAAIQLTSTDVAFAAKASQFGNLAYIEIETAADAAFQSAALWSGGDMTMRPASLVLASAAKRPRQTWPVNAALRGLGFKAIADHDEATSFGLDQYQDHDDIVAHAPRA